MERKYSVAEIDEMRQWVEFECLYGCRFSAFENSGQNTIVSHGHDGAEICKKVEERLRTYMLAGVDPKDLR